MTRLLLLTPFLAACVHTPDPCDTLPPPIYRATSECVWRNGGLDMKSSPRPPERPIAERPVDVSPPASTPDGNGAETGDKPKDHSRDDNGGSSDGNSDDGNGGDSHDD